MYELDFARLDQRPDALRATPDMPAEAPLPRAVVSSVGLFWQEHCVECAVPECYTTCPLYVRRSDGACARFAWGIAPSPELRGRYGFGADIHFRRWAKLEAAFVDGARVDAGGGIAEHDGPATIGPDDASAVQRLIRSTDALLVAVFVPPGEKPRRLVLESFAMVNAARQARFRGELSLREGWNIGTFATDRFGFEDDHPEVYVLVYPEVADTRLVFGWLDFVRFAPTERPADKVKVVAWDLDNTVWDGILAEGGGGAARLRPGVRETMQALDARGVLQTVVSKNDHAVAWPEIEAAGLAEYMLAPAIGWGPKSVSLRSIAARLNLGLDSFLLIDDSAFERAEVADALPMVRVVSDDAVAGLLARPELDLPATGLGAERRASYRTELARQSIEAEFGDDREAFLRSCGMELAIGTPDATNLDRCHELVMRSNQLNMSGRRYERETLVELVATEGIAAFTLSCKDRFGDYGLVGFVVIDERGDWPLVRDMVVSCRVAEKRVEATFFRWYLGRAKSRGHEKVFARLALTTKNRPMARALESGGFRVFRPGETQVLYDADIEVVLDARGPEAEPVRITQAP